MTQERNDRATLSPPQGETAGLEEGELEFAVSLFAALAHSTRLRMVDLLAEQGLTVKGIAEALGLQQSNASQNLAILSRAGVVKATREGTTHRYALRGPRIPEILRLAAKFRSSHAAALQRTSGTPQEAGTND